MVTRTHPVFGDLGTSVTNLFTFTADILPFSLERDIKPKQNDSVDTDQEVYNAENISVNKLLKLFFFALSLLFSRATA